MSKRIHLKITGRVQGVFFRDFVKKKALSLDLVGWVRNNDDGSVEVVAEGEEGALDQLAAACQKGPMAAKVLDIKVNKEKASEEFLKFEVRH